MCLTRRRLSGLVLEIDVFSGDSKLTQEIERSVQEIQFFDPAKAAEKAGPIEPS